MKGKYDGRNRVRMPSPKSDCEHVVERPAQVGHRDALVDDEPLDLVEDRAVRGVVLVGAEDAAGADDVDRRLAGQHRARLHGTGVGAQHEVVLGRVGPEGVLHRARGVVGAEVERVEVEPLGLDARALGDLPAHRHEDVGDPLGQRRDRVPGAARPAVPGQGDVDDLLDQHPLLGLGLELGLASGASAWLTAPRAWPTRWPASLRAAGGSAPISRLASASGERSPACSVRACFSSSRPDAAAIAASASRAHGLDVLLVERGHLDRVVLGVGPGHGRLPLDSGCTLARGRQSRNPAYVATNRFPPGLRVPVGHRPARRCRGGRRRRRRRRSRPRRRGRGTRPLHDVHPEPGAAADAVLPELGEHPLADLLGDARRPRRRPGSARRGTACRWAAP